MMVVTRSALTDKLLSAILDLTPEVQSLSADSVDLREGTHKNTSWSVTELKIHMFSISGFDKLPQLVGDNTCRVSCQKVLLDSTWLEVGHTHTYTYITHTHTRTNTHTQTHTHTCFRYACAYLQGSSTAIAGRQSA